MSHLATIFETITRTVRSEAIAKYRKLANEVDVDMPVNRYNPHLEETSW
jgi:hypothetical protein